MAVFDLPSTTIVNRVIPKNTFDKFITAKQKKRFTELIEKIRWSNKLSAETINLNGKEIREIQIFEIDLKSNADISDLLALIDKAIPYPIIFYVSFQEKAYISIAKKHAHPTNEHQSVIDWTFNSRWKPKENINVQLNLKASLDFIFHDFCFQLSSKTFKTSNVEELVSLEQKQAELLRKIQNLKASINRSKQYNRKVELNIELQKVKADLTNLPSQNKL